MTTASALEVVSKPHITPKSKAWSDEKTQHTGVCIQCQGQGPLILTKEDHNTAIGCQMGFSNLL